MLLLLLFFNCFLFVTPVTNFVQLEGVIKYSNYDKEDHYVQVSNCIMLKGESFIDGLLDNKCRIIENHNEIIAEIIGTFIGAWQEGSSDMANELFYIGTKEKRGVLWHYYYIDSESTKRVIVITTKDNRVAAVFELESYIFLPLAEVQFLKVRKANNRRLTLVHSSMPADLEYADRKMRPDSYTTVVLFNKDGSIRGVKSNYRSKRSLLQPFDFQWAFS